MALCHLLLLVPVIAGNGPDDKAFIDELEKENPQCEFSAAQANENPRALLDELLRRAGRGDFLRTDHWLDTAVLCPGYLPAPDQYTVIDSYKVVSFSVKGKRARASVEYRYIGTMGPGPDQKAHIVESRRTETAVLEMTKTPFGWRFSNETLTQVYQNVLLKAAVAREHLEAPAPRP